MLGFDPDRVRELSRAVDELVAALGSVVVHDAAAAQAVMSLLRCRQLLEPWPPRLIGLAASPVLVDHRTSGLAGRAAVEALVLRGAGWVVAPGSGAGRLLSDRETVQRLRRLGDADLGELLDHLAVERRLHLQGTSTSWGTTAEIDRVVALVARALGPFRDGECSRVEAVIDTAPTDLAGVLLASVVADDSAWARLAAGVLTRWYERQHGVADESAWPLDSPADHLFRVASRSAERSRLLLDGLISSPHGLHLLTDTATDPRWSTDVVLAATDPDGCDTTTAGRYVRPYVEHVLDGIGSADVPYDIRHTDLLGAVVAPWLLQMTSRAADWDWDPVTAARTLARVLHDAEAMATCAAERDRLLSGLTSVIEPDDPGRTASALRDLSGMLGWLDEILHEEGVADELADRFWWDLSWSVVDRAVSFGIGAAGLGGGAWAGVAFIIGRLREHAESAGWGPAPRPNGSVLEDAARRHDLARVALASATVTAMAEVFTVAGHLPADLGPPPAPLDDPRTACPSLDWRTRWDAWLEQVDEPERTALDGAAATMLNPYQAAATCDDLLE